MRPTSRTTLTALITAAAATAGLVLTAPHAIADDDGDRDGTDWPIQIESVHYNPIGADTRAKLNQEYVTIENDSSRDRSLRGWTLRDRAGHVYRFGPVTVPADHEVRIHTGAGTNTTRDRYWGRSHFVWGNHGDTVILRNAAGTRADRCRYSGGRHVADC